LARINQGIKSMKYSVMFLIAAVLAVNLMSCNAPAIKSAVQDYSCTTDQECFDQCQEFGGIDCE
jgi:hypothetical protein